MTCTVRHRQRVRSAAAELRACDGVLAADVLAPTEGTTQGWALELTCSRPLSAAVLERLAAHALSVPEAAPRGSGWWALATA